MKPLILLLLLICAPAHAQDQLRHDSTLALRFPDNNFGGFSSLVVSANGASFMATSDRGYLLRANILRENGRMVGVENLNLTPILDTKGNQLTGLHSDAEGLAVGRSGEVYMSFEGNHRIMVQSSVEALPAFLPKHPEFRTLINNSGLEALALDGSDVLYAIPERSGNTAQPFPVYRLLGGSWDRSLSLPRRGGFLVTGADIFDGQLYVLERNLSGLLGFSSRIRRFDIASGLGFEQTLLTTLAGDFDNLEGISLWQPVEGPTRVLLISDDNFRFFQKNQLVEFVLEPAGH